MFHGRADHVRTGTGYQCVRCFHGLPRLQVPAAPIVGSRGRMSQPPPGVLATPVLIAVDSIDPDFKKAQKPKMVKPVAYDDGSDFEVGDDMISG